MSLSGSYSFQKAVFKAGGYKGQDIPMVPQHKFNLSLAHLFTEFLSGAVTLNYMSSRRFINDEANKWPSLKQAFTVDLKMGFQKNDYQITGGINNLFNGKFYEYGVCNAVTGAVNYYPAPGRNFFIRVSKKF